MLATPAMASAAGQTATIVFSTASHRLAVALAHGSLAPVAPEVLVVAARSLEEEAGRHLEAGQAGKEITAARAATRSMRAALVVVVVSAR
jgi:hypothetical protein